MVLARNTSKHMGAFKEAAGDAGVSPGGPLNICLQVRSRINLSRASVYVVLSTAGARPSACVAVRFFHSRSRSFGFIDEPVRQRACTSAAAHVFGSFSSDGHLQRCDDWVSRHPVPALSHQFGFDPDRFLDGKPVG